MKRIFRYLRLLKKNDKGGVLILVAASMMVLIGMSALAIDVGQLYVVKRQMVNAADSAALAGALNMHKDSQNPESNNSRTRLTAKHYALENDANESFDLVDDIKFTGSGDNLTIHVRTFKEVHYTFARVLGFGPTAEVYAYASANVGPGNPVVPFVNVAVPDDECDGLPEDECESDHNFFYEGDDEDDPERGFYYMENDVGEPAIYGDRFEIHGERWDDTSTPGAGEFSYVRLPGMESGGSDLRKALSGGYEGELSAICEGEVVPSQTGQVHGALRPALEYRIALAGEDHCTVPEDLPGTWYDCILVVVIPLVIEALEGPAPKPYKIVGFASLLLGLEDYEGEKYVYAYFLEYLNCEGLKSKVNLADNLESYTVRLVKTDPNPF